MMSVAHGLAYGRQAGLSLAVPLVTCFNRLFTTTTPSRNQPWYMLASRRTGNAVVEANEYSLYAAMRVPARRPFGGRWCGCARCRQGWLLLHSILLFYGTQQYGRCLIYSACPNSLSPSTARSLCCPPKNENANGGKENGNSPYNKFIRNNLCNGAMNEPCLMVRKSLRFSFPPTQKTS